MKVSLIEICAHCGHEVQELLGENFQNWVWTMDKDFRVRLATKPKGEEESRSIFELRISPDVLDTIPDLSHLVRGKQTLCGLSDWRAGNSDLVFGVKNGMTTCVPCLRTFASELLGGIEPTTLRMPLKSDK